MAAAPPQRLRSVALAAAVLSVLATAYATEEVGHGVPAAAGHGHESPSGSSHAGGHEGGDGQGGDHGEHASAHGHESGHHVSPSDVGTTTAIMLLGFVAFTMALFYLVNWHDEDIRLYTWVIVSCTVSIFLAVLIFSAVSEGIDFFLPDSFVSVVILFLLCWSITQGSLFAFKGSPADDRDQTSSRSGDQAEAQPLEATTTSEPSIDSEKVEVPNVRLKAFGTILAHITGFAGIKCRFALQSTFPFFASGVLASLLTIPIFLLVALGLIYLSSALRKRVVLGTGNMKEDTSEASWREQCRETEDDAAALILSSVACASIRFAITGSVPTEHGSTDGRWPLEVLKLFGAGSLGLVGASIFTYKLTLLEEDKSEWDEESIHSQKLFDTGRVYNCASIFAGLTMSWCFYFGTQWGLFVFLPAGLTGVTGKLMEAVLVSFSSMLAIFVLDYVGDGDNHRKKALKGLITSLGLLVGISWEGSFSMGVLEIAVHYDDPATKLLVKSFLALILVATVLPAWRLYIMPKSEPEIMRYYQGHNPPLRAFCMGWDPVKDFKLSKTTKKKMMRSKMKSQIPPDST